MAWGMDTSPTPIWAVLDIEPGPSTALLQHPCCVGITTSHYR